MCYRGSTVFLSTVCGIRWAVARSASIHQTTNSVYTHTHFFLNADVVCELAAGIVIVPKH